MIKAEPGFVATFKSDSQIRNSMEVVAWDDEGRALVLDEKLGYLRPATSYSNFLRIEKEEAPVVAAVPGQGWTIQERQDDGSVHTFPVVAFAIDSGGYGRVIVATGDGFVEPDRSLDGEKNLLIPPGGWSDDNTSKENNR